MALVNSLSPDAQGTLPCLPRCVGRSFGWRGSGRSFSSVQRRDLYFVFGLDGQTRANENPKMDNEPKEETSDRTNRGTPEPTQEAPQSKLRDLRPEKDPMGAGRNRLPKTGAENLL